MVKQTKLLHTDKAKELLQRTWSEVNSSMAYCEGKDRETVTHSTVQSEL